MFADVHIEKVCLMSVKIKKLSFLYARTLTEKTCAFLEIQEYIDSIQSTKYFGNCVHIFVSG